mmetsp:Transcript_9789/g.12099  ORF Transcript_9789/g.12099 Transcript_9789/m.12099 type:complete len:84 (-) Transcript_9789:48-299(-)
MLAMHYKLGEALTERMRTFFPVIVHSSVGEERECIDIIWVDHNAETADKFLLQAIFNGQEIETSADATGVDFMRRPEEETIDI